MYITFVFSSVLLYEEWGFSHSNRFFESDINIHQCRGTIVINVHMISMRIFTLLVPWVLPGLTYRI